MNFEEWYFNPKRDYTDDYYDLAKDAYNFALDEAVKAILYNNCISNMGVPSDKDIALLRSLEAIKELKE